MDPLIKAAQEHGYISEKMAFFRKALPIMKKKKDVDQMILFGSFLNEYVVAHFKYEEADIFPFLIERCQAKDISFIQALQSEHVQITSIVEKFFTVLDDIIMKTGKARFQELSVLMTDIITRTLYHAQQEDESLFPLIKIYIPFVLGRSSGPSHHFK